MQAAKDGDLSSNDRDRSTSISSTTSTNVAGMTHAIETSNCVDCDDLNKQLQEAKKEIELWNEVSDKNPMIIKLQKQNKALTKQNEQL